MPGTIKLINGNRNRRAKKVAYYHNGDDITMIVNWWRNLYGLKFETYFIHLLPNLKKCIIKQPA